MEKILYDIDNIKTNLNNIIKEVQNLETIKDNVLALSTNYNQINLTNSKKSINDNIDIILEDYLTIVNKAKNLCKEYEDFDNHLLRTDDFLNKQYVSADLLKQLGWINVNDYLVADLNYTLNKYEINTPERIKHFISQCSHESGGGQWLEELASGEAYENRIDLGNIEPGDGKKYKGAGFIQLTGRNNYTDFANEMNDPEILNQGAKYVAKNYPWACAGFWWSNNNMNDLVDSKASVTTISRAVNGGYNGLEDRKYYYNKISEIYNEK